MRILEVFNGANELYEDPIECISEVQVRYTLPDPRGGSGALAFVPSKGKNALISIYDHEDNLCAAKSLAVLLVYKAYRTQSRNFVRSTQTYQKLVTETFLGLLSKMLMSQTKISKPFVIGR